MFGGGGFAGDGGNQFAGGGFMPSQAQEPGYGGGGGGGSGGGKRNNQTLRTLTIRQIAKELVNADDDTHMVDGVELANVAVIGKILGVTDRNTNLALTLSDGTGELEVNVWLTEESEQTLQNKKAELRPGVYVKAHGHMRTFDKKLCLSAFSLRPITNFNEVTYHYLRAIFEHLHLTKGGAAAAQGMPGAAGGFGNPVGGAWGGAPQQQQPMGGGATTFAGAGGVDGCQTAVLAIMQAVTSDKGLHVEEVYSRLAGQFNKGQIDQSIAALMNDAHIYNTVDDFHYKAT